MSKNNDYDILVPHIPRGNDFKLAVRLLENVVVGNHKLEKREIEGTVTITSVNLVLPSCRRIALIQGEPVNGSNTWQINEGNNIVISFFEMLPKGKYGLEIIFLLDGSDRRFSAPPGLGFVIVEHSHEGFVPANTVMTYQVGANVGLGTLVDLSGYPTNQQFNTALANKVDKENGKGLSTNDFDNTYKEKLDDVDNTPTENSQKLVKSGGVKSAIEDATQSVGYAVCTTAAATAAKTVSLSGYTLRTGGSLHILMNNANTASNVTLKIGDAVAKNLFYNGSQASSSNTWEAGEVIEVYYDGMYYQATNFQGGGGSAERISYDGQGQSLLSSDNVQGAINEIAEHITEIIVGKITLTPSANPSTLEVGQSASVTIKGTASEAIDNLKITYNGSSQSANTATTVQKTVSVTPSEVATYTFTVSGTHKGVNISPVTGRFYATRRTYIGAGDSAASVVTGNGELVRSISKTYNVPFVSDNYLFIVTPLTVTSIKDEMGSAVDFVKLENYNTHWNVYRSEIPMLAGLTVKFTIIAN